MYKAGGLHHFLHKFFFFSEAIRLFFVYFISPSGKRWPLNFHFVFDLLAVGAVILVVVTLLLPKSIELKRIREPKESSNSKETRTVQVQVVEEDSKDSQERTQQS